MWHMPLGHQPGPAQWPQDEMKPVSLLTGPEPRSVSENSAHRARPDLWGPAEAVPSSFAATPCPLMIYCIVTKLTGVPSEPLQGHSLI